MIPASTHRQTRIGAEAQAETGDVVQKQTEDSQWKNHLRPPRPRKAELQCLGNPANYIELVRRDERQDGAGSKDIEQRDQWCREKNRVAEVPTRIAAFPSKNGRVFKPAKRAEGHFAED